MSKIKSYQYFKTFTYSPLNIVNNNIERRFTSSNSSRSIMKLSIAINSYLQNNRYMKPL